MISVRGAPGSVISILRMAREGAFRVVGAFERPSSGHSGSRAPLWLRRHTGPLSFVEGAAGAMMSLIAGRGLIAPGSTVVDAGCGFGVMAETIGKLIGPTGSYRGFDHHAPSIRWAERNIAIADGRLEFAVVDIGEPGFRFPIGDGETDFFLAKSLFTHLTADAARSAMTETARVLKKDSGRALVTAFLFDAARVPRQAVPYSGSDPRVRWLVRARPEAAIAYERDFFETLIADAGLTVLEFLPAFWPGRPRLDAQDTLLLGRR
jgi:SAM-dependent methyltransferase